MVQSEREMTVDQHLRTALLFLEHSDREFAAGDELQGSEKLWGAASQSVMAFCKQRGWNFGKSNARKAAVQRLADEYDEPLLVSDFSVADKFHANFYHHFMEDEDVQRDRALVHRFVHRVVALTRLEDGAQPGQGA